MKRLIALGAILLVQALASHAGAHSWYPKDCCSDFDCAPADKVVVMSSEFLAITSVHGTAFVHATFPRRDSTDHRMHVCMTKDYTTGNMKPLCVFIPPSN